MKCEINNNCFVLLALFDCMKTDHNKTFLILISKIDTHYEILGTYVNCKVHPKIALSSSSIYFKISILE